MKHSHRFCVVGLLALMILCGCRRHEAEPPPIAVQVATLKREPIVSETRFSATVRERHRIELSFKVPGTLAEVLQLSGPDGTMHDVHEGDAVTADADHPLARLDDSDYKRRMTTAQDRLAQVEAKERSAMAAVTAIRANFERIAGLRERGSVAQQAYDDVLAKRDSADAELDAVRREVSGASVALQQAEDDWKHCSLTSPIADAIVSRKYTETGERVAAGQPVFEIMDLSQVRVAFGVPDTQLERFQLGQNVKVMADAIRGELFTGRVTKVLPAADLKTRTFEVEVTIDAPKLLRPGMVVTIIIGRRETVVLVPMTAIQRGEGPNDLTVYTVADENGQKIARKRRVVLDGVYDNRIRLIEGEGSEVAAGDPIVVAGTFRLIDGQPVRVLDVEEAVLKIGY